LQIFLKKISKNIQEKKKNPLNSHILSIEDTEENNIAICASINFLWLLN